MLIRFLLCVCALAVPVRAEQIVAASRRGNAVLVCDSRPHHVDYGDLSNPQIWSLAPLKHRCSLQGDSRHWFKWGTAFSRDGRILAFACQDNSTVEIFDARSGKLRTRLRHVPNYPFSHVIGSVAFSPDGRTLAVGTAQKLWIWNWRRKKLLFSTSVLYRVELDGEFQGAAQPVNPVALQFSPDGKTLAFAGGELMPVFLFDMAARRVRRVLRVDVNEGTTHALCFSPNGSYLLALEYCGGSGDYFDQMHLFNARTGQLGWRWDNDYHNFNTPNYRFGTFSSDGESVAVANNEHLEVRDARNGQVKFVREFRTQNWKTRELPSLSLQQQKQLLSELAVR